MSLTVVQSSVDKVQVRNIIEAALLAAGRPLDESALMALFGTVDPPPRDTLREVISELQEEYESRGIQLVEVASGWRVQVRSEMASWLSRLWEARPPRFSRALLETLCLIAYRQPITRGEIEDVRGVSVSVNIVRTLLDRHWIRCVGHRDVPGKPEMFGTTREFLDYFGLKGLDDLPSLAELRDFESPNVELDFAPPIATQIALKEGDAESEEVLADEQHEESGQVDEEPSSDLQEDSAADDELSSDLQEDSAADDELSSDLQEDNAADEPEAVLEQESVEAVDEQDNESHASDDDDIERAQ